MGVHIVEIDPPGDEKAVQWHRAALGDSQICPAKNPECLIPEYPAPQREALGECGTPAGSLRRRARGEGVRESTPAVTPLAATPPADTTTCGVWTDAHTIYSEHVCR